MGLREGHTIMANQNASNSMFQVKEASRLIGFELNLEKNLIFVPRTFAGKSFERVVEEKTDEGEILTRKLSVGKTRNGDEVGVMYIPTHYPMALILHELWEDAGKPEDRILTHTLYELNKARGVSASSRNREKTENLLEDFRTIPLRFEASWFIKSERAHAEKLKPFTILDYLDISKKTIIRNGKQIVKGMIRWRFDQNVIQSLLNHHTHPTLKDAIFTITQFRDTAIPFYNFTDRMLSQIEKPRPMALENFWEQATQFPAPQYARKRDLYARAKKILKEVDGKPLSSGGYVSIDLKPNSNKDGYNVHITKKADDSGAVESRKASVIARMEKAGIYKKDAKAHAEALDLSLIEAWLDAIPQLEEKGIKKVASYIHQALTNGDPVSDKFLEAKEASIKKAERVDMTIWFCGNSDCPEHNMAHRVPYTQWPTACHVCGSSVTA